MACSQHPPHRRIMLSRCRVSRTQTKSRTRVLSKSMVVALSGYSAYFDASMDKEKTEMLVAGYVSTLEEWCQFEISWKLTLAKYDVPFFKMSEFIGRRKEYS